AADRACRKPVRRGRPGLEVPGPARADAEPLLEELRRGASAAMILVTGGTGFVGGHVVRRLRVEDRPVRCLVRDRRKAGPLEDLGVEVVEGDVTDAESLMKAVAGCEAVVHLVAIRQGKAEEF